MFDKINQMKDLYAFKKQSDALKKQMEAIITTVYHKNFKVVVRGDQTVISVAENDVDRKDITEAINKAIKESQKEVGKKMKNQLGGMGLPGL